MTCGTMSVTRDMSDAPSPSANSKKSDYSVCVAKLIKPKTCRSRTHQLSILSNIVPITCVLAKIMISFDEINLSFMKFILFYHSNFHSIQCYLL